MPKAAAGKRGKAEKTKRGKKGKSSLIHGLFNVHMLCHALRAPSRSALNTADRLRPQRPQAWPLRLHVLRQRAA
jgi:hypothetical protein